MLQSRLPVRPFEIVYDAADPYARPVVVDSPEDGMRVRVEADGREWGNEAAVLTDTRFASTVDAQLAFDAVQQVLTAIEFYEVNRVALKFGRVVIFGGDIAATFMSIYNVRGPRLICFGSSRWC